MNKPEDSLEKKPVRIPKEIPILDNDDYEESEWLLDNDFSDFLDNEREF